MSAGEILGIVLTFGIFLIPSGIFVGVLAGNVLKLAPMTRLIATVAAALALSAGVVFFPGPVDDPSDLTSTTYQR